MRILKNILLVLSTGYIFVYFSEHLFWSRIRPGDSFKDWFGTWMIYSLMAFGWIDEGIVVQTAYDMLPRFRLRDWRGTPSLPSGLDGTRSDDHSCSQTPGPC